MVGHEENDVACGIDEWFRGGACFLVAGTAHAGNIDFTAVLTASGAMGAFVHTGLAELVIWAFAGHDSAAIFAYDSVSCFGFWHVISLPQKWGYGIIVQRT